MIHSLQQIKKLIHMYKEENYFLVVNEQKAADFQVFVSFKVCTNYNLVKTELSLHWQCLRLFSLPRRKEPQAYPFFEVYGKPIGYIKTGAGQIISLTDLNRAWSN